jgi:hypothetical protein
LNTKIKSYEEIKKKTEKEKKKRRKKTETDPGNPSSPAPVAAHGPVMKPEPVPLSLSHLADVRVRTVSTDTFFLLQLKSRR